ncbi:unnamed protein product [Macrosiphum euphorbiae]|uniref:Uncharacterized protein n=1 Tax=Macrosiphum euphorbiae TaxID=13131 RepID=A0AAV0VKK7_9HEMI|nr:unnamed protein product [Macrosiphum euphorbiae]
METVCIEESRQTVNRSAPRRQASPSETVYTAKFSVKLQDAWSPDRRVHCDLPMTRFSRSGHFSAIE